ncbi:MAG: deoxyribose-phosphate aldolase [Aigarchaeota archaeon]|nr:deoxyribose-phosphate aldolase [Candidatus Wolframiiraptor gerlachensis]
MSMEITPLRVSDIGGPKHAPLDARAIAGVIEHTLLKPNATEDDIKRLCEEARKYGFATVCINPIYIPLAKDLLRGSNVKVCVAVGFPLGATFSEVKVFEAKKYVEEGADEIDMVMNISMFKSGRYDYVLREKREVKEAVGDKMLKVIIETCYLSDEEKVRAAKIVEEAGADFVKTSTGFGPAGAKVEDVKLLRGVLSPRVRIKASGGIRTAKQVIELVKAGADRIGTSSGVNIMKELEKMSL